MKRLAYIALGSNLGSKEGGRAQTLSAARACLRELGAVVASSSLYETDPVGYRDQPEFLNAVVALETELDPMALLERMRELERDFGREQDKTEQGKVKTGGPRTLDLDLLLIGDLAIESARLTVPHPALAQRRFVLVPLQEIAPDLRPPGSRHTIAELLARLPDEGENRVSAVRRYAPARAGGGWPG